MCAHPCQIAGAGKYPGCPKKSCERGSADSSRRSVASCLNILAPKPKPGSLHFFSRGVPDTRPHAPHDRAREVAASGTGSRRRGSRVEARRERVRRDTRFATSRRRHDGKRQNILSRWCTNTPTRRSSTAPPRWRACRSCRSRTLSETSSRERTSRRWRSISGIPRSTRIKVRALRP